MIGDFNLEQHQAYIGYAIQSGGTHACDSCEGAGNLPMTGPGRKRRIDFALSHWRLPALSVQHRECHFSDHVVVRYDFLPNAPKARTGPKPRKVAERTAEQIKELFHACQTQPISQAIANAQIDEAWLLLSDVAEQCLCEAGASFVPRSADWSPSPPLTHHKGRKALCSPSVACLRRLRGRLCRSWDQALLAKILTSLAGVRYLVPELPVFSPDCLHSAAPCVKQLLLAYEKHERGAILSAWQAKLKREDHRIRSFVKNRTEQPAAV